MGNQRNYRGAQHDTVSQSVAAAYREDHNGLGSSGDRRGLGQFPQDAGYMHSGAVPRSAQSYPDSISTNSEARIPTRNVPPSPEHYSAGFDVISGHVDVGRLGSSRRDPCSLLDKERSLAAETDK